MCGVLTRPWRTPEALWAVGGAVALVLVGVLPWTEAAAAVGKGTDVYLFLVGMMLLSEVARREGLFDYLAAVCVQRANGSATRLFLLVYAVGTVVTVFMSNDATAVVLTPAVLAVSRRAKVTPLPYLLACAFIANAASFVLPISNPANLVIFGERMPSLLHWFGRFALPSVLAIAATYGVLRLVHRTELSEPVATDIALPALSGAGKLAAAGIVVTAVVLLAASASGTSLGLPTLLAAAAVCIAVLVRKREAPWALARHVSWSVLALVAGLFVLVEGLQRAGVLAWLTEAMRAGVAASETGTALIAGAGIAFACNLLNNLPAGLIASSVVTGAGAHPLVQSAVAIGVDLGPNLSVTGSLATILWLVAIRREGENVTGWQFFKVGALAMPVALALALLGLLLQAALLA
ncbi:MAG: Arsenical pump rane protein [Ramlibacter sp.]|nr:Arsenical pump rane protein [Ramlibacter sp.]